MADMRRRTAATVELDGLLAEGGVRMRLMEGDKDADVVAVRVRMDGQDADLTGYTASAEMRRGDGTRVECEGSVDGAQILIEFNEHCYVIAGEMQLSVRLRKGTGQSVTVLVIHGEVLERGDGAVVDIDESLVDVEAVLALYGEMVAAVEAAQKAAGRIENMTVLADTLEPGRNATVAKGSNASGGIQLRFGIPRGDRGTTIYSGDDVTGTSTTPAVFATGIADARIGDLYLNTGTGDDTGNVYECTTGGDAATALWAYRTNWRGAPGVGSVSTVDGLQPGGTGNVQINAVRYSAQTLTTTQKKQAQTNIGLDGVVDDVAALKVKFQTGALSVAAEAGVVSTQTVTFPEAFASTPAVMVVLNSNATAVLNGGNCAPSGVSATGFTCNVFRQSAGNVPVRWLAFIP